MNAVRDNETIVILLNETDVLGKRKACGSIFNLRAHAPAQMEA
jgi:hypothetical protein